MRFGLIGTGYWAKVTHAVGVQNAHGAELVGVWGRDREKREGLASDLGVTAYDSVEAMLDDVDAVTFSVPPHVQAEHAVTAAEAGKHLLLEKPVATSADDARRVAAAVSASGVASVVFFTARFQPEFTEWVTRMAAGGPWRGAWWHWLSAATGPDSNFNTPWRREQGALWDIGPHLIAGLEGGLGPVTEVLSAARGEMDLTYLTFRHESGATSSAVLTIKADPRVHYSRGVFFGDADIVEAPGRETPAERAHQTAVEQLVGAASSGEAHPVDVHYGTRVVELLAEAERLAGPPR